MGMLSRLMGGGHSRPAPVFFTGREAGIDEDIPRYPPFAKGLPVASVGRLLKSQEEMTQRIRAALGFSADSFDQLVWPVLENYTAFVHLLPASETHHHRGAGGLLRHGLEVAFWATQASESVIFSMEGTPQSRRDNEPRWRLTACLTGLLHDVGKPLSDVAVTDMSGKLVWNPYFESLLAWAERQHIERYFLRWRDNRHKRHEKFSLLAIDRLIPQDTMGYLSVADGQMIQAMLEAISGTGVNEPVTRLMLTADRQSVAHDMKQSRLDTDLHALGVPVERYVFDGIRRLIQSGAWKVNVPGAKVWVLQHGVFIAWKNLDELYALFERDKIPGIPRDADTLADILIERGFAIARTASENEQQAQYRYWPVTPKLAGLPAKTRLLMLRLESPQLAFTNELPAALEAFVEGLDAVEEQASVLNATATEERSLDVDGQEENEIVSTVPPEPVKRKASKPAKLSAQSVPHMAIEAEPASPILIDKSAYREKIAQYLHAYGQTGQVLMRLLLHEDGLAPLVLRHNKHFGLVYPDALHAQGNPKEVLAQLDQAGLVQHTDTFPSKKLHDIDGQKVALFPKSLCDVLGQPVTDYSNAPIQAVAPAAPAAKNRRRKAVEQAPEPEQVSGTTNLNPEQACEALITMMQKGSGAWLVDPVSREGSMLSTSGNALDRIAHEHPHLPRLVLMACLGMHPALTLRGNTLYLQAQQEHKLEN